MRISTLIPSLLFSFFICLAVVAQDTKPEKPASTKKDTSAIKPKNLRDLKVKPRKNDVKIAPAGNSKDTGAGKDNGHSEIPEIKGSAPVIKETRNGSINWTQQYITAKGSSVLDTSRFKNPAQARMMATRGAMVVAQRNLLEIIKGVEVTGETTVQDMVATSDYVYSRVDGIVKGAQQVGEAIMKDGMVEVTMRVPLYETNGLAPALYDNLPATPKDVNATAAREEMTGDTSTANLEKIAFNLAGKAINPSMFPIIVDENNNLLLDMSKIYDPKTGKFPKIVQASKEILNQTGYKNAVKVLDVLDTKDGKIVIDNASVKKINWGKIGKTAATISKFLLMLI